MKKKLTLAQLEAEIRRHNHLYFVEHRPEISDLAFDQLVEELKNRKPHSAVLLELTSDITSQDKRIKHSRPMLSLDKCYDDETLSKWAEKFADGIIAMPKIDGCAVSLRYDENGQLALAATRGTGAEGEDITENVKYISSLPQKIALKNVEVRGEIFMPLSVFKHFKEEFANPRNLAAGAIKLKNPEETQKYRLQFLAFDLLDAGAKTEHEKREMLKKSHFPVAETKKVFRENLHEAYDYFAAKRHELDFEIDGVVYRVDEVAEQERLGFTNHHPRYAIAYKFQGDSNSTTLVDVEWSVSRTGAITPVGIVEPVELSGATVRRASLHNLGMLEKLGASKGARVLMVRRGGVIPHVESVVKPGKEPIQIPKKCPSCGAPTERRDDFLFCTNSKNCLSSKVGELEHFIKVVEIDGFGGKMIEKLYAEGFVTEPAEFYELNIDDLLSLERMGEVLAAKLVRNVQSRRELPLEVFLQSLGIDGLGKHAAQILSEFGDLASVRNVTEEELLEKHGLGEITAQNIIAGLKAKKKNIEHLLKYITVLTAPKKAKPSGPLAGKKVLFTGTMLSMERKAAQKQVEAAGGIAVDSVVKDLDYLVVGDGGGAGSKLGKVKKMQAKGSEVKILSEAEFVKLF